MAEMGWRECTRLILSPLRFLNQAPHGTGFLPVHSLPLRLRIGYPVNLRRRVGRRTPEREGERIEDVHAGTQKFGHSCADGLTARTQRESDAAGGKEEGERGGGLP